MLSHLLTRALAFVTLFSAFGSCDPKTGNRAAEPAQIEASQAPSTPTIFPQNSMGVVYLDTTQNGRYHLTLRFPNFSAPENTIARDTSGFYNDVPLHMAPQNITLFDEAGELVTLENVTRCVSRFWCENDGGTQFEPTYVLTVKQVLFKRPLRLKNPKILEKISCFAVINYHAAHLKSLYPENEQVLMHGRLSSNADEDRNVQLTVAEDDSGVTDYRITLRAFNSWRDFDIGCSGP